MRNRTAPDRSGTRRPAGGFTLIELIAVMAIVAILVSSAAPTFKATLSSYRIAGEVNALVGDLQYARAEAIKEGQAVTVCVSSDGASCLNGEGWQVGHIVFSDPNQNATVDAGEATLRVQAAFAGTDTLASDNLVRAITFNRDGFAIGLPANPVTLTLHDSSGDAGLTRCLAVSLVGRITVQHAGTGNCQ